MGIRDIPHVSPAFALLLASVLASARDFRAMDDREAGHPSVLAMKFMGERISEATRGKYGVRIYANASLGSAGSAVELVRIGAIDMARVSTAEFYGILPELRVLSLPFLFRDAEHFRKTMNGPVGDEIRKSYDRTGWIGLCFYETGTRSLYAKKPIRAPADARGMKTRAAPLASVDRHRRRPGRRADAGSRNRCLCGAENRLARCGRKQCPRLRDERA
jgi:TRAP-type C4-dicarboxylate transport system substrate-binding protein